MLNLREVSQGNDPPDEVKSCLAYYNVLLNV